MTESAVVIGRHINGVTLNPLEYLLNEDDTIKTFPNETEAKNFLREAGASEEDLEAFVFEEVIPCEVEQ